MIHLDADPEDERDTCRREEDVDITRDAAADVAAAVG